MTIITQKTKETNTFRFKSFADRVNEIDIRRLALYHIGHENEELPEDNETYFHQTLKKWIVLNLTEEYNTFSRRCMKIVTLPQLILKKNFIIDLILERLATATNLSLQPLLELLYVLARDLREEFYPYFQRVLDRLICLLNTQDAEQLEWTLICLAYMFKTLKPYLKKNIGIVFHTILPLLDEQRYAEHVTNFAVECFSFIARDIRDYRKFMDFILETVQREEVECVQGCGRLLFEMVRGVKGLFHSVAGDFLQFIFEYLVDDKRNNKETEQILSDIVKHSVANLLQFIYPSNMNLFWLKLCDVTRARINTNKIEYIIEIFLMATEYRDGRYLAELDIVVPTILKMLDQCMLSKTTNALRLLASLTAKVLLSGSTLLTQLDTSRLLKKTLTIKEREIYDEFILCITQHAQFEILVLPAVVTYFEEHFDMQAFELMAKVVAQKQPLALNAKGLESWRVYPIALKSTAIEAKLSTIFNEFQLSDDNVAQHMLLMLVVPHLRGIQKTSLEAPLKKEAQKLLESLANETASVDKNLVVLSVIIETLIHLEFKLEKSFVKQAVSVLLPLCTHFKGLCILNQLLAQQKVLAKNTDEITDKIAPLLSSHSHDIRLTSTHCLYLLHKSQADSMPYKICYDAECIEPNVQNYRDQLLHLQKLNTSGEFYKSMKEDKCKTHILQFLLGLLYQNFKLVWEPVQKLIEEYAKELKVQDFWDIFKAKLIETTEQIHCLDGSDLMTEYAHDSAHIWQQDSLNQLFPTTTTTIAKLTKQQLMNYRNLLWSRLSHYGKVAEIKNRELIPIFLDFVNKEYRKFIETQEFTWDLCKDSTMEITEIVEAEDSDLENESYAEQNNKRLQKQKRKDNKQQVQAKFILQTLQSKLGCLVVQPNPKALYREAEIYALYMDLLAGPNAQLQKMALDCVLSYKSKHLTPYKETLYAINDEQKFKNELISFKLESVNADAREDFMHILLRILYGKMITKSTQRQLSAQTRKSLILRFMGQCSMEEIFWFLKMAFGRYEKYTNEQLENVPSLVTTTFDIHAVWSPKKLQSIVNLLELIRKEFGGLMQEEFQIYMLKLLLFVGAVCNEVINAADSTAMHPKMPTVFKNVRNAALQSLINFFEHITEFDWQEQHIQCFTDVFVKSTIAKMPQECLHTPTVLLKLFLQWSEQPKHFIYLNQQCGKHVIFHYVIELLLNEKTKPAVRRPILAMIERMLVAATNDVTQDGLVIVKPFIPQILQYLQTAAVKRTAKRPIDKRELNILSLLTAHVVDATTCDSLLQLLLPILIAKTQANAEDEVINQIVTTLANLLKRLHAPELYLRKIAPLFEHIQDVAARKILCQMIADIAKKHLKGTGEKNVELCERLKQTARLVLMLNAWDKRWVEQPDYDKRLAALKELTQMLEDGTVDMDLGLLVIYNCFYFIKYDKDIGLRDNATEHLQLILPKLTNKYSNDKRELNYLVNDVFINLISRILRNTNDNVRNEGIRLLGVMARQCPTAHEILNDLCPLGDALDTEVDFFENLIHLQSHRHGRALLKFCTHAATLKKVPNARTLTQFILPTAARYLLNEKHASKHTLVDAAIDTVGIVCQLLPWQQYHTILRYYLTKMRFAQEHQKQSVRIVVRILDAFHFDVSQAETDLETLKKLKTVLIESENTKIPVDGKEIEKIVENIKKDTEGDVDENEDNDENAVQNDDNQEDLDFDGEMIDESDDQLNNVANVISVEEVFVLNKPLLLSAAASKRVMTTITSILIPTLNRSITEKSSYDNKHKVNRKRLSFEREEEEILRVPIALALVKLMQKLPKDLLDTSLPGVFMKVCTFLRSPLKSVRMLTRDILKKIMLTLGASYLSMLMDHLQSLLTRGFQVHVLVVTVHGVLDTLRTMMQPTDIASCLHNLVEVALNDIFGAVNAEKEVEKIVKHTPEAKASAKSFLILHIAARNIPETCLLDLLLPFKDHLARSHSRKLTLKIQDCFAKIVSGLVENGNLSRESLLIFIHGTMSESITDLLPGIQKRVLSEQEKEKMRRARPDCFIIQPASRMRSGAVYKNIKSSAHANAHILIEFGLELLHFVLKRKKLIQVDYEPFINPILPLLKDALKSTHIRVTTFALKCFGAIWNDEYELPALAQYLKEVVERMFEILKNFSTFGATKQEDNSRLVKSAFKAIVSLLHKCKEYELTAEQIDQLILHVEQDLYEGDNVAMSFSLLKALINRKVDTPAVHDIIKRISDLSIQSHSDFVRNESRNIILIYIMEYTLHKRVEPIVKFFSVQLCYSLASGRQSAISFLQAIIKKFPLTVLSKQAEFLYLSLATRLVNDDDTDCRKAVAETIEMLISKLSKPDRQRLFDMTLVFFESTVSKNSVREMAAALLSRFINVEKQTFSVRLKIVLPTVIGRLTFSNPHEAGRFVRAPNLLEQVTIAPKVEKKKKRLMPVVEILNGGGDSTEEAIAERQRGLDHEIIQIQFCILKLLEHCVDEMLNNNELTHYVDELAYESQKLLAHDHTWVRCNAAKIINCIIAGYDFQLVGQKLCKLNVDTSAKLDFIYLNPEYDIKSLVLDMCAQFQPDDTSQQMIDEIAKLFLYVGNMLKDVPFSLKKEKFDETEEHLADNESLTNINLKWLMHNVRYLVNKELVRASHSITMRSSLFTLIEAFISLFSIDTLIKLGPALVSVLVREMSEEDQNVDAVLRQQALRVGSRLRKRIGSDIYDKLRTAAQTSLMIRRADRRKQLAQEKVNDPVRAAKRKVAVQERKKLFKKRKTLVMRGKAEDVKQKLKKRKRKAEADIF